MRSIITQKEEIMSFAIGPALVREQITRKSLRGKKIVVNTYEELNRLLHSKPVLRDKKGNVTTHISGLFHNTLMLLSQGIKPCFVLDGPFPEIQKHQKTTSISTSSRITQTITPAIIASTKTILTLLGVPVIQSPSEAEAQAAYMAKKRKVYAVASQTFDSLLFGAPRIVHNLIPLSKKSYIYDLKQNLKHLQITQDQLIALSMLTGTDFNPSIQHMNIKRGLELVKRYKHRTDKLFRFVPWRYQYQWKEVYDCIKTMPITNKYKLQWKKPHTELLFEFLVKEHNFSEQKVRNALNKIL